MRLLLILLLALWPVRLAAAPVDPTPRTAIIAAFPPEWGALRRTLAHPEPRRINGIDFVTGTIAGKPVLLFLSGVSIVNAAMTTQLALDRFRIKRILFSGVAGGVDPTLDVGDVVVADRWAEYLESAFARATPQGFVPPRGDDGAAGLPGYGMIVPRTVAVRRPDGVPERRLWFPADPALLAIARTVAAQVTLRRCAADRCLEAQPRIRVGGNGVSGPVFMDNAEFRAYLFKTFGAQLVDMETAAVAHVALSNAVPFIGFRSLSDLAGGGGQENQAAIFYPLASENSAAVVTAFVAALPD